MSSKPEKQPANRVSSAAVVFVPHDADRMAGSWHARADGLIVVMCPECGRPGVVDEDVDGVVKIKTTRKGGRVERTTCVASTLGCLFDRPLLLLDWRQRR